MTPVTRDDTENEKKNYLASEVDTMNAERATYYLRRFKSDEKMLGPNEQAALDFAISALTRPTQVDVSIRPFTEEERENARASIRNSGWAEAIRNNLPVFECGMLTSGELINPSPLGTSVGQRVAIVPLYAKIQSPNQDQQLL